ncbi:Protein DETOXIFICATION [Arachis hypogaea]|nr:Protein DETOXIFICATION [Arachis hypogaea]
MRQDKPIANQAGKYARCLIPSLFAHGLLQSILMFLQTQSIVFPIVITSVVAALLHILFYWLLVFCSFFCWLLCSFIFFFSYYNGQFRMVILVGMRMVILIFMWMIILIGLV